MSSLIERGELGRHLQNVVTAHQEMGKTPNDSLRFWDMKTPYAIHPIWCGITMLTETDLPEDVRMRGSRALLYHDFLEDTNIVLPDDLPNDVKVLVGEMTFASFEEEKKLLFNKPDEVILLKLFDKTSNLMDGVWMGPERMSDYIAFTEKILERVENVYGELNITKIARAIIERRRGNE